MSINASLIGQMITFAIFVWFCMKFIWPRLIGAISERQKKLADGLAAADKSQRELEAAQLKVVQLIDEAKAQAAEILENTQRRSQRLLEEAKTKAQEEYDSIVAAAQADIDQQINTARRELYDEVSQLVLAGTEKVLGRNITRGDNDRFIDDLIAGAK